MILQVFKSVGSTLSIVDAYTALISLYSNQIYPTKKAVGSIGGAVSCRNICNKRNSVSKDSPSLDIFQW